ncbi:hypothetical protein LSH36_124g03018 [Paralvinella palmiformis]|uniref:Histone deacetylase n=1 Tax=Paralvinella palmiformis TaxID=53620 RepID=A0AAD9JXB9_9ANNE|nr:hypothetical protein LSH36_124g03018 [Paralvinella palmiformis]
MEINNHHLTSLSRKDPQLISPVLYMAGAQPNVNDPELHAQYVNIEKHYRMQAELLSRQFEEQRRLLAHEQVKMQEYMKAMMIHKQQQEFLQQQQQKQLEEQREESELRERQRLEQIKHKGKNEQSAVASSEVKQKLRECLLNKGHRDNHFKNSPPDFRQWATQHSSLEQHSPPTSGLSPPLRAAHLMGRFEEDYPLRKTVSEPNLKMRSNIRHKVISRNSPLTRRRDINTMKRHPLAIDTTLSSSNPDSGPNSPPTSSQSSATDSSAPGNTAGQKDEPPAPLSMMSRMVINQSMPNISIGQPRDKLAKTESQSLSLSASEAELRARAALQYGLPLMGSYQYYPLPTTEGEVSPTNATLVEAQIKALELARSTGTLGLGHSMASNVPPPTLLNTMSLPESSYPRIQQSSRPPLHRAQSSPLPLPGQLLWNQQQLLLHKQQEQLMKESQKSYLKQKLQSALLQRSSSKTQMENVDEAAENRLTSDGATAADKEVDVVVIDDQKEAEASPPRPHKREREAFLLKMRQRAISSGSPPITAGIPENSIDVGPTTSMDLDYQPQSDRLYNTGVAYDTVMLKHECLCGNNSMHPENPDRLHAILSRLHDKGLISQCEKMKSRKATPEELKTCHSEAYVHMYSTSSHKRDQHVLETFFPRFCKLPCGGIGVDSDTVWNELYTPQATRMAAGCVIDLAFKVARGDLKNGFALVRPPGHHAEDTQAMGFCFFNSIAVATKLLLDRLQLKRILIVDWDVHHGNSTQQLFYTDPRVLYISLHRHDNGNFFPGTGAPEDCGIDKGVGFNVNIAFAGMLSPPMGDAEYLAAFRSLVMPIARQFEPELVLVSAGFDAADGHPAPLGGYKVTAPCFGYMTKQLMTLAGGKVVLVLEGGYILPALCDTAETCLRALLHMEVESISESELQRQPCKAALETMETTIKCQAHYWPCVTRQTIHLSSSFIDAQSREHEEADTVSAFASLSVVPEQPSGLPSDDVIPAGLPAGGTAAATSVEQPMEES